MYCLRCGHCCKTMSPFTHPEPCPYLTFDGDIANCSIYERRPKECRDHEYPSKFCPIGMDILKLDREQAAYRVQTMDFIGR